MNLLLAIFRFIFLSFIKIYSLLVYRIEVNAEGADESIDWDATKLILVLNHTSLYEPLYSHFIPFSFLWRMSRHLVYPIADVTKSKPFIGWIFNLMAPKAVSISRKRDGTWQKFIEEVRGKSVVILLPEGRMKRPDGLDKDGQPMSVRGGFFDVMQCIEAGNVLLVYSGGLHHINKPGQLLPRPFKVMKVGWEQFEVGELKSKFSGKDGKVAMVSFLEKRRDEFCPIADDTPRITKEEHH